MICERCGSFLPDDALTCDHCGAFLGDKGSSAMKDTGVRAIRQGRSGSQKPTLPVRQGGMREYGDYDLSPLPLDPADRAQRRRPVQPMSDTVRGSRPDTRRGVPVQSGHLRANPTPRKSVRLHPVRRHNINWMLIGLIVAVYLLFSRKKFARQSVLIIRSALKPKWAELLLDEVAFIDRMFGGFIDGKILDSAIIGVLCYIGCTIFRFPNALLVSAVVGITNVIPFFGPIIGAVPSTLLILIESPIKALWFVVFVLALQQLDGNVIGPKILGDRTGLSSFWVLFAILLFGGLWGFAGMIVGVPLFAVIYDVIKKLVIYGLRRNEELDMLNTYHDNFGDPEDDPPAPEAPAQAPSVDKT